MLGVLLPARLVITALVFVYALFVLITLAVLAADPTSWTALDFIKMSAIWVGPYTLLVSGLAWIGWRPVWQCFPGLNSLYPDLNGEWDLQIQWNRAGEVGQVSARASIRQTLLRISMEVDAPQSDSRTLSATPKKDAESGRPALHYIYLVTPHATNGIAPAPYTGAAILDVSGRAKDELSGNYWTSHQSVGRFVLRRHQKTLST